jgi:hypothetical protein
MTRPCRTGICKRAAVPDSPWCGACQQVRLSDAFGPGPLHALRDHYETLRAEVQPRTSRSGAEPPSLGSAPEPVARDVPRAVPFTLGARATAPTPGGRVEHADPVRAAAIPGS